MRYHLFNIKLIATEFLIFITWISLLVRALLDKGIQNQTISISLFLILVFIGILLIRSVRREVEQREKLEILTKELGMANKQLSDLNRFKTQLLSLASHQIKSPLAAVKGFVSLLLDGIYGKLNTKERAALRKIKNITDELIGLINTLLDLRRVEEGKMDYQFEKTDFKKIVSEVIDGLRPLAQNKKLDLKFVAAEKEAMVLADKEKLKGVIQNLIDNAIKYTEKGFVEARLQTKGGEVVLSVTDSGLGISAEFLPQLFEEFIRDERIKKQVRGSGLGLYIAKRIIEAHGGRIWAESEGEGKGSRFYLSLKRAS